jgi:cell division protein FtsX
MACSSSSAGRRLRVQFVGAPGAVVVTLLATLILAGCAAHSAATAPTRPTTAAVPVRIAVFMNATASSRQIRQMRSRLDLARPDVTRCEYLDHQASYRYMAKLLSKKAPVATGVLTPATTPTLFECQLTVPGLHPGYVRQWQKLPAVYQVGHS